MRRFAAVTLCLAGLSCTPLGAAAQDKSPAAAPSDSVIVDMAQKFIHEHFAGETGKRADIAFDIASIHPQPGGGFWAVVGGFLEKQTGSAGTPHAYGLTMRLSCAAHGDPNCWKLEKLLIDQKLIVDR